MSVQTLVSSPLTENWISKAIFQSAGGYDTGLNRDMPLSEAETIGQEFVELSAWFYRIVCIQRLRPVCHDGSAGTGGHGCSHELYA